MFLVDRELVATIQGVGSPPVVPDGRTMGGTAPVHRRPGGAGLTASMSSAADRACTSGHALPRHRTADLDHLRPNPPHVEPGRRVVTRPDKPGRVHDPPHQRHRVVGELAGGHVKAQEFPNRLLGSEATISSGNTGSSSQRADGVGPAAGNR